MTFPFDDIFWLTKQHLRAVRRFRRGGRDPGLRHEERSAPSPGPPGWNRTPIGWLQDSRPAIELRGR